MKKLLAGLAIGAAMSTGVLFGAATTATAADYPDRPILMMVSYGACLLYTSPSPRD